MIQTMLLIDDFFANPMEVREKALAFTYPPTHANDQYGGRTSIKTLLPPDSDQGFSQFLREPLRGREDTAHGRCRISFQDTERRGEIYVDLGCAWSGVVYLTLDEHCQGGTEFFRHKRYGTDRAPFSDEEARSVYSIESVDDVYEQVIRQGGRDLSQWEHIQTVPMRFNQAIYFDLGCGLTAASTLVIRWRTTASGKSCFLSSRANRKALIKILPLQGRGRKSEVSVGQSQET